MAANDGTQSRRTQELEPEQLTELRRSAGSEGEDEDSVREWMQGVDAREPGAEALRRSRTDTIQDPLTAALLAEVTRTSRTLEIDPDTMDEARQAASDQAPTGPPARRRQGG